MEKKKEDKVTDKFYQTHKLFWEVNLKFLWPKISFKRKIVYIYFNKRNMNLLSFIVWNIGKKLGHQKLVLDRVFLLSSFEALHNKLMEIQVSYFYV